MIKALAFGIVTAATAVCAAHASCGQSYCAVGTYGIAGANSGGNAQGGLFIGEEEVQPGTVVIVNAGNANAGNITISGAVSGFATGTFRNDASRGRSGGVLGDCTGFCLEEFD
jgi:hypothetical protein